MRAITQHWTDEKMETVALEADDNGAYVLSWPADGYREGMTVRLGAVPWQALLALLLDASPTLDAGERDALFVALDSVRDILGQRAAGRAEEHRLEEEAAALETARLAAEEKARDAAERARQIEEQEKTAAAAQALAAEEQARERVQQKEVFEAAVRAAVQSVLAERL